MEGYRVVTMDYAADKADIFVTATGNFHVITLDHMKKMRTRRSSATSAISTTKSTLPLLRIHLGKYQAAVAMSYSRRQTHHPAGRGTAGNLGCATGHPSYVMVLVLRESEPLQQIELFNNPDKYPLGVYVLPKHLDEKVARLQLRKLWAQLTELTDAQARYIGVRKKVRTAGALSLLSGAAVQ